MFYYKTVKYSLPEHFVLEEKEEVPLFDDTVLPVQKIHRTRSRDQTRLDIKPETAKRRKRKIDGHLSDGKFSEAKKVIEVMQHIPFEPSLCLLIYHVI